MTGPWATTFNRKLAQGERRGECASPRDCSAKETLDAPTLRLGLRWTPADEQASQRARREADHLRGEDPDLD